MDTSIPSCTQAQYLDYCHRHPNEKFEFFNDRIQAMSNTSFNHDAIKGDLTVEIGSYFKHHQIKCKVIPEGKLVIENNYFIPDVMVVCKQPDTSFFSDPIIIIEVVSDSTKRNDFGYKFK